ncbi:MAG TPA: hypothetical protein VMY99_03005 [Nevskiaceae bacterium]|nr:hypothetical protein [Nevskiaceae bacterium]
MAEKYDFSGVWRSTYRVPSGPNNKVIEVEHYMVLYPKGNRLVMESIPSTDGSYLIARFTLDGRIATGSYQSQNSPKTAAKGAIYYGAAQMVLDADGKTLRGMGVGFGKDMKVKTSDWQVVHIGQHHNHTHAAAGATHWSAQASRRVVKP